jgi:hypothetical protein
VTGAAEPEQEESLEEIDNPIERLKLLAGNDEEIANYLDAIEVTSPREREMLQEIARTHRSPARICFPRRIETRSKRSSPLPGTGTRGRGLVRARARFGWRSAGSSSSSRVTWSSPTSGMSQPR